MEYVCSEFYYTQKYFFLNAWYSEWFLYKLVVSLKNNNFVSSVEIGANEIESNRAMGLLSFSKEKNQKLTKYSALY
jgi:hypothetical protein